MPLLDCHLSTSSNTNTTYTLIRRSLIALVHVKNAEQFETLGDLIVQKFFDLLKSTDMSSETDVERLRKMMELVGVVSSVRQGSRLNGMLFVNNVGGSDIAQYSTDSNQASTFLGLFLPLLRKPPKIVRESQNQPAFATRKLGLILVEIVILMPHILHPVEKVPVPGMKGMETITTLLMRHYHSYPTLPLSSDLICTRTSLRTSPFRARTTTLEVDLRANMMKLPPVLDRNRMRLLEICSRTPINEI